MDRWTLSLGLWTLTSCTSSPAKDQQGSARPEVEDNTSAPGSGTTGSTIPPTDTAPDTGGESPLLHLAPVQAAPAAERGELGEGAVPRLRVPLARPRGGRPGSS